MTEYETETENATNTLTATPEGTHTTVEVRFYEAAPDDPDDPQPSEYTVIQPNPQGKYALTWDFTDETENYVQIVTTSEAVEASTWITVAKTTPVVEAPELSSLAFDGLTLDPTFDPDTRAYDAGTASSSSIEIDAAVEEGSECAMYCVTTTAEGATAESIAAQVLSWDDFLDLCDEIDVSDPTPFEDGKCELTLSDGDCVVGVLVVDDLESPTEFNTYWIDLTVSS